MIGRRRIRAAKPTHGGIAPRRRLRTKSKLTFFKSIWEELNRPLVVAIVTIGLIGFAAKVYADKQEAIRDQVERRTTISNLLVEYRQRLWALEEADAQLAPWLGDGPGLSRIKRVTDTERAVLTPLSVKVGSAERDVIRGSGTYTASSQAYANVNLQVIATQIELAAGIPDRQAGALQLIGFLNAEPDILWLFVRTYLPHMNEFYVKRYMLVVSRQLPLLRGEELTTQLEIVLGIPQPKPGDLEWAMKESDRLHKRAIRELRRSDGR